MPGLRAVASGLAGRLGWSGRAAPAPERMGQQEFTQFLRRRLQQDGWPVESAPFCDIIIKAGATTIFLLPGQLFYRWNEVTIPAILTFKAHDLKTGPYRNKLMVVVVHDPAMFEVYATEASDFVTFLRWQDLHHLLPLRDVLAIDPGLDERQRDWLMQVIARNPVLCRQRCVAELRARNLPAAIAWAERAIAADAEDAEGYHLLTRACLDAGALERAATVARQALGCPGANATSLLRMSEVEQRRGDQAAALDWVQRSLARDGRNAAAYHQLAGLQQALGDRAAARQAAERALRLAPDNAAFARRLGALAAD